jgi:hypothetical protein
VRSSPPEKNCSHIGSLRGSSHTRSRRSIRCLAASLIDQHVGDGGTHQSPRRQRALTRLLMQCQLPEEPRRSSSFPHLWSPRGGLDYLDILCHTCAPILKDGSFESEHEFDLVRHLAFRRRGKCRPEQGQFIAGWQFLRHVARHAALRVRG